ncbi:unnamed protein product [Parascedosporium putredinis]|uniref:Uncharacterized protein n=1 Tax=Parascedosporium putredinis TaxID=1442378 RepID=A0A9P1H5C0_9PEZI|nr:unnamed protein product [Parascedosporium putredinis]CAI7997616.1 unnamed protein product [Parascedosporium putredinis]
MSEKDITAAEPAPRAPNAAEPVVTAASEETAVPKSEKKDHGVLEQSNEKGGKNQPEARPERQAGVKDLVRVFGYATKWDYLAYLVGFFSSIAAGVSLPLVMVLFGQLVEKFQTFATPGALDPSLVDVDTLQERMGDFESEINRLSLFMTALFIVRFGCNYINKVTFRMVGIRMSSAVRAAFLRALFAQSIHIGISEKMGVLVEFTATIIASLVIAFIYSWRLTLVCFSATVFIMLTLGILLPLILKGVARLNRAESKATAIATEALSSVRIIAACGAEDACSSATESGRKRRGAWPRRSRLSCLSNSVSSYVFPSCLRSCLAPYFVVGTLANGIPQFFALWAVFGLAFWFGIKSYLDGVLSGVGDIVIVLMSSMMLVMSMERVSTPMLALGKAMLAACQFFTVIDAPLPNPGHLKAPEVAATDDINFNDVTFAYPSRPDVKVLDNLNLSIPAGKLTAIVGPSGSGKSTIVGLIQRWYALDDQYIIEKAIGQEEMEKRKKKAAKAKAREKRMKKGKATAPSDESSDEEDEANAEDKATGEPIKNGGRITCGTTPIDDIQAIWWRTQIGLVQQEPFLFNDTIFKNVAYGLIGSLWENESEEKKRELVKEACTEAFASEFIDRLPEGYDTIVGESGAKLSGGQRQRIAIARSIVRKPKILILDEATSAIDVRGEKIVQAALDKVAQGRTTITIAHRLSTIKKADCIIVLKKGQVVEKGTHQTLLENPAGVYSGLVLAQQLNLGDTAEGNESDDYDEKLETAMRQGTNRGFIAGYGRLLVEQRNLRVFLALTIFFAACVGAGIPVMAYLFAKVIVVFNYVGDPEKMRSESNHWSLMWVVFAIAIGFSYFFLGTVSQHIAVSIEDVYRREYFESILYQKMSFFDNDENAQGILTSRISGDPKLFQEMTGLNMGMVYSSIFSLLGGMLIAFIFGWKLAIVAFFVTMPIGLFSAFFRVKYELEFERMNGEVFDSSSKFAAETIGAFRTVSSLTLEDTIATRYETLLHSHVVTAFRKALWTSLIFAFSDSSSLGCQALIFWYGGRLMLKGELDNTAFFICMMAVVQGAESAGQGLSFGPNVAQASEASNRILNVRETRNKDDISKDVGIPDTDGGVKIELRDVHFKYPSRNVPVFKGLNLTIEKGQFAALVGASGCGKTSIISLLERFYDPAMGQILVNDKDVQELNVYSYRNYLSLVAQEPTLFQGTLRENILLGVDPEQTTEEQLHAACRDASIHDFIVSLPDGYNTSVGSKGVSLSGGQKQRVAIARALIRDPKVLLLDEATSSLDSESEKLVQAAFERAGEGRTMVVVAHRLATVQNADVIFVLGEGKLLEQGSHTELLKAKGVYWNMCQSQALDR